MKLVRFDRHFASYNAGEAASFSDEDADLLIAKGVASLEQAEAPRFDLSAANKDAGGKRLADHPEPRLAPAVRAQLLALANKPQPKSVSAAKHAEGMARSRAFAKGE